MLPPALNVALDRFKAHKQCRLRYSGGVKLLTIFVRYTPKIVSTSSPTSTLLLADVCGSHKRRKQCRLLPLWSPVTKYFSSFHS
jgi:hypothetical protein